MSAQRHITMTLEMDWSYKRQQGIFGGMQKYADDQGWMVTVAPFLNANLPFQWNERARFDGVLGLATTQLADWCAQKRMPLVNVWFQSPVRELLPGVFSDFKASGILRAEHLLSRGLSNYCVVLRNSKAHRLEADSFSSVLDEAGYSCDTIIVTEAPWNTITKWKRNTQILESQMENWRLPIGVYVSEELTARLLVQMCRDRDWKVPDDVVIIAGDNEETVCEFPRPSLTSVEYGHERVGYEAARLLGRIMEGKEPAQTQVNVPPVGLVVRESSDFFAVEDELVAEALVFISSNSHRQIMADDVSRAVAAETRTLQLRFRKFLGRPIATEIRRARLERAKRELSHSRRPIAEISRAVGFGRGKRMYRVFMRELGISPSDYRKQRQANWPG